MDKNLSTDYCYKKVLLIALRKIMVLLRILTFRNTYGSLTLLSEMESDCYTVFYLKQTRLFIFMRNS